MVVKVTGTVTENVAGKAENFSLYDITPEYFICICFNFEMFKTNYKLVLAPQYFDKCAINKKCKNLDVFCKKLAQILKANRIL